MAHAEKQALVQLLDALKIKVDKAEADAQRTPIKNVLALGVSKEPCSDDCLRFMSVVAKLTSRIIAIGAPADVFVFMPDGRIFLVKPQP
jgi:hypothetical protein